MTCTHYITIAIFNLPLLLFNVVLQRCICVPISRINFVDVTAPIVLHIRRMCQFLSLRTAYVCISGAKLY